MKDVLKVVKMTILGLFVASVIYPFLHECGHMLASVANGGMIKEFVLFPTPYIMCDISRITNNGLIIIGLSGLLFPFVLSVVMHPKKFMIWYAVFILKCIVQLSLVMSAIIIIMNKLGIIVDSDDMTKVLGYWQTGSGILMILLTVVMAAMMVSVANDQPLKRIYKYFDI